MYTYIIAEGFVLVMHAIAGPHGEYEYWSTVYHLASSIASFRVWGTVFHIGLILEHRYIS